MATRYLWEYIQEPYIWGGDVLSEKGLDCSGLVCFGLRAVGVVPQGWRKSSRSIYRHFTELGCQVDGPGRGRLVFWSSKGNPERISHVAWCLDRWHCIEAGGGGPSTTTLEAAHEQDAYVKLRAIERDRPIVGYVDPFLALGE